jgi:hypothetical protein
LECYGNGGAMLTWPERTDERRIPLYFGRTVRLAIRPQDTISDLDGNEWKWNEQERTWQR